LPLLQESARSNFFVQRILESISEEDVALSWARAVAGGQGASRLRNTLWRVWHLMRKRSQVSREEENEAETESEFESLASSPSRADLLLSPPGRLPALLESELESQKDSIYLVLISLHGLVRGTEMELGRDSDTGGQVRYVVELARALAQHPRVHRCDLFTRLITDPSVDASYGVVEERLTEEQEGDAGAFIVRLRAGKPDVYLHKELLWPHLREFADRAIERIDGQLRSLEASHGRQFRLLCIHGHYADAAELSSLIGATLSGRVVVTGHSLGRNKLASILASGKMTRAEVEATYRIGRRIEAEERALGASRWSMRLRPVLTPPAFRLGGLRHRLHGD
jgi:sucrose-phosphate synthase